MLEYGNTVACLNEIVQRSYLELNEITVDFLFQCVAGQKEVVSRVFLSSAAVAQQNQQNQQTPGSSGGLPTQEEMAVAMERMYAQLSAVTQQVAANNSNPGSNPTPLPATPIRLMQDFSNLSPEALLELFPNVMNGAGPGTNTQQAQGQTATVPSAQAPAGTGTRASWGRADVDRFF